MKTIKEVNYKQEQQEVEGVKFIDNFITFEDDTQAIRYGIQDIQGKTVEAMAMSLFKAVREKTGWWSLQTTSLNEVKAAYRIGFRKSGMSYLKEHMEAFEKQGGTLHMEYGDKA